MAVLKANHKTVSKVLLKCYLPLFKRIHIQVIRDQGKCIIFLTVGDP